MYVVIHLPISVLCLVNGSNRTINLKITPQQNKQLSRFWWLLKRQSYSVKTKRAWNCSNFFTIHHYFQSCFCWPQNEQNTENKYMMNYFQIYSTSRYNINLRQRLLHYLSIITMCLFLNCGSQFSIIWCFKVKRTVCSVITIFANKIGVIMPESAIAVQRWHLNHHMH